ncbi:MAG: LysR family transcriptional regulator [Acetobacteraceae bacterium]|nr:LysR family transcriptional regulator [Acetobacteraceae bacterium]
MRHLPSMNAMRAFEAAARCGGFAAAARELHVSAAAVSRMVALLEAALGVTLFHRRANALVPTPAGRDFAAGLTPVFDRLATLAARARAQAAHPVLTVGAGPSFAARWLIPRLAAFQTAHPTIDVRIATGGIAAPFADDWSCGIRLGRGSWPGLAAHKLIEAELRPVCAPALAAKLPTPAALAGAKLLRVRHAPEDWAEWLAAAGQPQLRADGPEFDIYSQAQQAACDGLGVAIGIRPYVDDDLRGGRLVAPFALALPKRAAWHLVWRPERQDDPAFRAFQAWIIAVASGAAQPIRTAEARRSRMPSSIVRG